MPEIVPLIGGESGSQRDSNVPANKPGTRTMDGKAIVIELSSSSDDEDDHEDKVYEAADGGATPTPHLIPETARDTTAPEAAASKKRKSEKTSSVSSSLPSSRSLSESQYTPDWLKNRDNPAEGEPITEEIEEKEEEKKQEKKEPKEEKNRAKKAKKDEEELASQDGLSQSAGERPPRRPLPYTQDTGYITSGPLPQVEDPDPTPASFWQDKAPGVEDWLKDAE